MAIVKGTLWTTIPKGHWQNGEIMLRM